MRTEEAMTVYALKFDGGSYLGKCPIYDQAMGAAEGYARDSGLSVLVSRTDERDTREIVVHPDGDITHLWDGER